MKRKLTVLIAVLTVLTLGFIFSCTSEETSNLPQEVQNMLTPDQLKVLEEHGLIINEGINPPDIQGVYYSNYNYCTFDSTGLIEGSTVDNYFWTFYDQNDKNVKLDYTAQTIQDQASGAGAFITGDGELFSVFVELVGVNFGVDYTTVMVISGRKTTDGINDFMFGLILTDKDTTADPFDAIMMPIDGHRIFEEYDDLAESSVWPKALSTQGDLQFSIPGILTGVVY
jgi:hypothetical protein